jgi:clan AA aspartic protease (TIGR02281 family)
MSGFLGILMLFFIIKPSKINKPDVTIVKAKQETFIRLTPRNGHKYIYTSINGISTTFMLDTGASISTISESYLNKHIRSEFINRSSNFIRKGIYFIANGESVVAEVWQLPSMRLGSKTIYNIEVAVMPGIDDTGFLLGMSTINKLGNPKIDLANNKIIIN